MIKTSHRTSKGTLATSSRGFSLIELLVVVGLIAIVTVMALPNITSYFRVSLETAARKMGSTVKETYNATVVGGIVYRVVYDLKAGQYWVEQGPSTALLDTVETKEREERRQKFMREGEKPKSPFSLAKSVTRGKQSLPRGVYFEDVVTQQSREPITPESENPIAYTHFFPHGLTEQTVIHLRDESKHRSSLVISPLVGRTDVYNRYVAPEEIFK